MAKIMLYFTVFLFQVLHVCFLGDEAPLVETSVGIIRGHYKRSYGGRTFSAFEGISYAKAPVGLLRFKEPQNAEPWPGIWNATTEYECMQLNTQNYEVIGNEDCLYLNIYVPRLNPTPTETLDVLVYIHGGAFMFGRPSEGGPEYLMDKNIVYVNLNYRVGVLGFLSTEDDVVSGNNGLKDQVMALKWVQSHIHKFGGNPESVTIIGLSAGGASVHFHYLSPLSKGLFHRGISQSGTALMPWALQEAPLEKARKLAAPVGCNESSTRKLVECLQQTDGKQIVENTKVLFAYLEYPLAPFAPVIERESKTAFLTEHPYKLLKCGDVYDAPWMTSVTTDEGIFPVITFIDKLDDINTHWNEVLPHLLDYNYTVADSHKNKVAQILKEYYLNNGTISADNINSLIKLFGDRYFVLDFEKSARMQAKANKAPVYSYIYGYEGQQSLSQIFHSKKRYGVAHGEDGYLLYYVTVFGTTIKKKKLSLDDEAIKNVFLEIVTSFAKDGKPNVEGVYWAPITNFSDFGHLRIDQPKEIKMVYENELVPTEFWSSLPIAENEDAAPIKDEL